MPYLRMHVSIFPEYIGRNLELPPGFTSEQMKDAVPDEAWATGIANLARPPSPFPNIYVPSTQTSTAYSDGQVYLSGSWDYIIAWWNHYRFVPNSPGSVVGTVYNEQTVYVPHPLFTDYWQHDLPAGAENRRRSAPGFLVLGDVEVSTTTGLHTNSGPNGQTTTRQDYQYVS